MAEIKDLQLGTNIEALQPSIERVAPEVEITTVAPMQETQPSTKIEPLSTRKVGPQIQASLENKTIGMDTPDLRASTFDARTWLAYLKNKRQGEELPQ